jgi:hypothetical protein
VSRDTQYALPFVRLATWLVPAIARWPGSDDNEYSARDLKLIRLVACRRALSRNMVNEYSFRQENIAAISAMRFPEDLPVLLFVSRQTADNVRKDERRDWLRMQEDEIRHVTYGKAMMLPGGHFLHGTARNGWRRRSGRSSKGSKRGEVRHRGGEQHEADSSRWACRKGGTSY